jgi:hypothetical protein
MIKLLSVGAIVMVATTATAQAAETEYRLTVCGHAKGITLETGPDLTVFSNEVWSIVVPPATPKVFENSTGHCVAYNRIMQGKVTDMGSCRWTDPAGDTFIGEYVDAPDKPGTWTFLSGTGKWKGISGSGTYQPVAMGKPAADGSIEFCTLLTGKYTLPQ